WSLRYNECIENLSSCRTEDARRANQARNAAFSGFQSTGCMEVMASLNEKELKAFLACPANALFVNSSGKKIGFYQGSFINEIPNASCKVDEESEYYVLPLYDAYRVEIHGTGSGLADISIMKDNGNGAYSTTYFHTIPIQNGSKYVGTIGVEGAIQTISSSTTTLTAQTKTSSNSDPIWNKINSIGKQNPSFEVQSNEKQNQKEYPDLDPKKNQNQNSTSNQNKAPIASFEMMPNNPKTGDHIVLVSTSKDPDGEKLSYEWFLEQRMMGRVDRLEIEAIFPGPQTITLIVTDTGGSTSSAQKQINVYESGDSTFSFDDIDEDTLLLGAKLLGALIVFFILFSLFRKQRRKKEEWVQVKEITPTPPEEYQKPKEKIQEKTQEYRFCGKCGHKLEAGSRFCGSCGASITV
ncbi:MAG: zinc ribbon domain-containing protein, partial [Saprospiraceae bacterium]|nr:zinc ribbon domain-containing protein [Saprospiraceae bacterium]